MTKKYVNLIMLMALTVSLVCLKSFASDNSLKDDILSDNQSKSTSSTSRANDTDDTIDSCATVTILSFDSGGVKEFIPLRILQHIEEELDKYFGPDVRIANCFDLIVGTSGGGLCALALTKPKENDKHQPQYSVKEIIAISKEHLTNVMPQPSWGFIGTMTRMACSYFKSIYSNDILTQSNLKIFGETRFKDAVTHVMIPTYQVTGSNIFIFDSEKAKDSFDWDYLMKDIATSATAVPLYFDPAKIRNANEENRSYVDGIFYAFNPTLLAIQKARVLYPKAQKFFILSLGTGSISRPNIYGSIKYGGLANWLPHLFNIAQDSTGQFYDYLLEDIKIILEREGKELIYKRIQPQIHESENSFDNTDPRIIKSLLVKGLNCCVGGGELQDKVKFSIELLKNYLLNKDYCPKEDLHSKRILTTIANIAQTTRKTLDLKHSNIQDIDIKTIVKELKKQSNIEKVNLSDNPLTAYSARALNDLLKSCTSIKSLKLDNNKIGDLGITFLKSLLEETSLQKLSLKNTNISNSSLFTIARWLQANKQLKVNIRENPHITVEDLALFATHQRIKWDE